MRSCLYAIYMDTMHLFHCHFYQFVCAAHCDVLEGCEVGVDTGIRAFYRSTGMTPPSNGRAMRYTHARLFT
jgi:hypothetical protein